MANSSLVKTALFGEDANWGRILAAAGRAQAYLRPEKTDIYFNNVPVCQNGVGCGGATETDATRILKKSEFI